MSNANPLWSINAFAANTLVKQLLVVFAISTLGLTSSVYGQTDFTDQQIEFFENKIRPLLVTHCFECHGPEAAPLEGGLSLASREDILDGGDSGAAIVPYDPDESLLVQSVTYEDLYEMPPSGKLPDEKIEDLKKWVEMGAPWPVETAKPKSAKREVFNLNERKESHWSWHAPQKQPPQKPASIKHWPANPIDQYVAQKLHEKGLQPVGRTDKQTLIRRIAFDLTGIAPTAAEVKAFVEDKSPDATEKLIDRLLDSPRFGEHWARHWLDLMRYAETCGHEFDYPIPHAYQYRDYVIRAFNADVPYDQFVREHVAGDLLAKPRKHPTDLYNESILGTGMWYLGEDVHAPVDVRAHLASRIDNQIDVLTKSFLGMTVACARCHDHKFDAISTEDFYSLAGYIKSSRRQLAMLDPGQKIQQKWKKIKERLQTADKTVAELLQQIESNQGGQLADYLAPALKVLRTHQGKWNAGKPYTIQGESLKRIKPETGILEVQTIAARGKFAWQGNQQLWWRDGKIGDRWTLEFKNPFDKKTTCSGKLCLTIAADYGRASIRINGQPVDEVDCYATSLGTTLVTFEDLALQDKNTIELKILKPNGRAIPRNMLGVDYIEIQPPKVNQDEWTNRLDDLASSHGLNQALFRKTVDAIKSLPDSKERVTAPLKKWVQEKELRNWIDTTRAKVLKEKKQSAKTTKSFADIRNGMPPNWTLSGFAFSPPVSEPGYSVARNGIEGTGYVSSGRFGKKFRGILRTPTFQLNDDTIHFRVRGENFRIRVVVENFRMDDYNPLLFKGVQIRQKSVPGFTWLTMRGDLKLQLGHRAFIEFLDEGDGWIDVEQVVFGRERGPGSSRPLEQVLAQLNPPPQDGENTSEEFADGIQSWLVKPGTTNEKLEFVNWLVDSELLNIVAFPPKKVATVFEAHEPGFDSKWRTIRKELAQLANAVPAPILAQAMADGNGEDEFIFVRGNHKNLGQVAPRKFLSALDENRESETEAKQGSGSGRLSLAERIASSDNPLTSRVIVNRLWHHLIGRGIVESTDNFGVLGKKPTHPELLDYLAIKMTEEQWSIKRMLKTIMLTEVYQRASRNTDPRAQELDPENLLLHRANIKRLSGESIRDTMLSISGRLNEKMYGPSVPVHLTPFMQGRGRPGKSGPFDGHGRRSIYIAVRRNFLSPMMLAFDTPIPFNSIGRRNRSNVPAQALILMNDPLVLNLAETWGKKLIEQSELFEDRIRSAYESAYSREPNSEELQSSLAFLEQHAKTLGLGDKAGDDVRLWRDYCHVLFNVKDFIYIH